MMLADTYEVLESDVIELDPCLTGFSGALRELVYTGEQYVYRETALSSGNRVFSFSSSAEVLPRALFEKEADARIAFPILGAGADCADEFSHETGCAAPAPALARSVRK